MPYSIQAGKVKNEIILHIGPPKTGTTSLQHALKVNKKNLEDLNIRMPGLMPNQLNLFGREICEKPECLTIEPNLVDSQKVVLSAESFAQAVFHGDFFRLTSNLESSDLVSDIIVIYAKRSFAKIAISAAIQSCYRSGQLDAKHPFREKTTNNLKRFICTGQLARRMQVPILNRLLENNLKITILDMQGGKDINQLFFQDFLKLKESGLIIDSVGKMNATSDRKKEAIVLKFMKEVLGKMNAANEKETKRKNFAEQLVNRQNFASSELFESLISQRCSNEIEKEEKDYEKIINARHNLLTVL